MIPQDPEEVTLLAGEYVLGVIEARERHEVESDLPSNPMLRDAVDFWQEKLLPLTAAIPAAAPAADGWENIRRRLAAPSRGSSVGLRAWRAAALGLGAIAAALAVYIGAGLVLPRQAAAPQLIAVLSTPQTKQAGWVATADRDGLVVRNLVGETAPADRCFELWGIAPGAKAPVPLGVIPASGSLRLKPDTDLANVTLAISVEPVGGSPTGLPTGPVVYVGAMKPI